MRDVLISVLFFTCWTVEHERNINLFVENYNFIIAYFFYLSLNVTPPPDAQDKINFKLLYAKVHIVMYL